MTRAYLQYLDKVYPVDTLKEAKKKATEIGMGVGVSFLYTRNSEEKKYTKIEIKKVCIYCNRIIRSRTRIVEGEVDGNFVYKITSVPGCKSPYCIQLNQFLNMNLQSHKTARILIEEFDKTHEFRLSENIDMQSYRYDGWTPSCIINDI